MTLTISVLDLDQLMDEVLTILESKVTRQPSMVLFDSLTNEHVSKVGQLIASSKLEGEQRFIIGSSGVSNAIASLYQSGERYTDASATSGADQLLVISGSCSPATEKQIQWALSHNFEGLSLTLHEIMEASQDQSGKARILARAIDQINNGKSLIIYTALGPDDPSIKKNQENIIKNGHPISDSSKILGSFLGNLAKTIIKDTGLKRLVFAGDDTSSYATRQLGIYALEMITRVAPGAPLCRCYSDGPDLDGLEIALKSGQFGPEDYFNQVLEN
ncbi:four-carbon acid sugar kinase family protein [Sporolactobacillus vineae]|uniref:four-carbon acid sugar kinase family protein n=2 Tax=Sporolactobacillus vineae TaxID=444463 RepID=UPI00037D4336|nr:nucleotide-binding domain containing protein [Sporolactobacillus vineae]